MYNKYPKEFDPFLQKSKPKGSKWIAIFVIGLLSLMVYANEYPDSSISEFTKNLGSEIKISSSQTQAAIGTSTGTANVNVRQFAMTSIDDNRWDGKTIKSEGVIDKYPPVGGRFYLFSEDLKYKVALIGNIPPNTSPSCGFMSFPYYRVTGKVGIDVISGTYLLSVDSYSLVKCISVR